MIKKRILTHVNIQGNSPEVVQGNLDLGLVVKLTEMSSKIAQLSLKAEDRNIGCRILETQPLHASTEIQSVTRLCNLLLSVLYFIILRFVIVVVIVSHLSSNIFNNLVISPRKIQCPINNLFFNWIQHLLQHERSAANTFPFLQLMNLLCKLGFQHGKLMKGWALSMC